MPAPDPCRRRASRARARLLEPRDNFLQFVRSFSPPGAMGDRGSRAFGELQAMMEELAPAAQIDRLARLSRDFEAQDIAIKPQRFFRLGRNHFDMSELRDQAVDTSFPPRTK